MKNLKLTPKKVLKALAFIGFTILCITLVQHLLTHPNLF